MKTGLLAQSALGKSRLLEGFSEPHDRVVHHARAESIFKYAFQAQKHTRMCEARPRLRRMEKTPDQKREVLRRFITDNGLKIARWAKEAGVDKNSIYNFLNEHSSSLDMRTYAKLARVVNVPAWKISGDQPEPSGPHTIWVVGKVQAGLWQEAVEWPEYDREAVDVPVPDRFRSKAKALRVEGESMNLEYPDGSIAVFVDFLDFREPQHGDHVVVYAHAKDGAIEATLKEMRVVDDKTWLWPRSDHPEHQAPMDPECPPDHVADIEVKGIVIGGYRPRIF